MKEQRIIRAEILSGTTDRVRDIVTRLSRETNQLTADELGTLSIIIGIDGQIKREAEEQRPRLRII